MDCNKNRQSYENPDVIEHYTMLAKNGLLKYEKAIFTKFLTPGMRILDIGCGAGRTTKPLKDMGMNIIGVDVSQSMIKRAKELYPDVDFRVCDIADDKCLKGEKFDAAIFSYNGIILLTPDEKKAAIKNISSLIKKNGLFIFTATPINMNYVTATALRHGLKLADYGDRLKLGMMKFFDNGSDVDIYIPFRTDLCSMLKASGLEVIFEQSSHSMIPNPEEGLNDTLVWVTKKL